MNDELETQTLQCEPCICTEDSELEGWDEMSVGTVVLLAFILGLIIG